MYIVYEAVKIYLEHLGNKLRKIIAGIKLKGAQMYGSADNTSNYVFLGIFLLEICANLKGDL